MNLPVSRNILFISAIFLCLVLCFSVPGEAGRYETLAGLSAFFMILLNQPKPNQDFAGIELSFFPYRHDNMLLNIFPLKGRVIKYVTLSGENDWLLVKLDLPFQYQQMNIAHVLIKRSDKQALVPNKANQLVFFTLVPYPDKLTDGENNKSDFPLNFWALCK